MQEREPSSMSPVLVVVGVAVVYCLSFAVLLVDELMLHWVIPHLSEPTKAALRIVYWPLIALVRYFL